MGHPKFTPKTASSMGVDHTVDRGTCPSLFEVGGRNMCFVPPLSGEHLILYIYYFTKFTTLVTIYIYLYRFMTANPFPAILHAQ